MERKSEVGSEKQGYLFSLELTDYGSSVIGILYNILYNYNHDPDYDDEYCCHNCYYHSKNHHHFNDKTGYYRCGELLGQPW